MTTKHIYNDILSVERKFCKTNFPVKNDFFFICLEALVLPCYHCPLSKKKKIENKAAGAETVVSLDLLCTGTWKCNGTSLSEETGWVMNV